MEAHSLKLPRGYIKDSVGVGDAFYSGVLYTARKELPFARSIKLGTTFAASSFSQPAPPRAYAPAQRPK